MKDTDHTTDWEARYQSGRTGWDRGDTSPALRGWLEQGELRPCNILVPGAGRGFEVLALARAGFDVTAVDLAPTPVHILRDALAREELGAKVEQADLLSWQAPTPFDAVYDQTCLCALNPRYWNDYAQRLRTWLAPGGRLFALFMQTHRDGGPPFHCDVGHMRSLFDAEHWRWPDTPPRHVPHPSGLHELAVVLQRR